MSYDVDFIVVGSTGARATVGQFNYTSNCSDQWRAVGIEISEWSGRRASDVTGEMAWGITQIRADKARFRAMNPENGWGDTDSMLSDFLDPMLRICWAWPEAVIEVSR